MSFQALNWAVQQRTGDPTLKLLLLTLANYADERGVSWPSQRQLALDTEICERTVRSKLEMLEVKGLIEREARGGRKSKIGGRQSDLIKLRLDRAATCDLSGKQEGGYRQNQGGYRQLVAAQEPPIEPSGSEPPIINTVDVDRQAKKEFAERPPRADVLPVPTATVSNVDDIVVDGIVIFSGIELKDLCQQFYLFKNVRDRLRGLWRGLASVRVDDGERKRAALAILRKRHDEAVIKTAQKPHNPNAGLRHESAQSFAERKASEQARLRALEMRRQANSPERIARREAMRVNG